MARGAHITLNGREFALVVTAETLDRLEEEFGCVWQELLTRLDGFRVRQYAALFRIVSGATDLTVEQVVTLFGEVATYRDAINAVALAFQNSMPPKEDGEANASVAPANPQ